MRRSSCLALVVAGCGFSATANPSGDAATVDTLVVVDAPATPDAPAGPDASTMAVTTDFPSVADIYLRTGASPNENTNDRDYFIVDGDIVATGLVRFDLAAVPAASVVSVAQLVLWDEGDQGAAETIHQMLEGWDEATATSNQRATGMAWLAAGAAPPSRDATVAAMFTPATANVSYTIDLPIALVQTWVTTPATNFGLAIVTTNSDGARFAARENATVAHRPALHVVYTPP